jgi:hypothetical protein
MLERDQPEPGEAVAVIKPPWHPRVLDPRPLVRPPQREPVLITAAP